MVSSVSPRTLPFRKKALWAAALRLPSWLSRLQVRIWSSKPSLGRASSRRRERSRRREITPSTKPTAIMSRSSGTKSMSPTTCTGPADTRSSTVCGAAGASSSTVAWPLFSATRMPGSSGFRSAGNRPFSSLRAPGSCRRPPEVSMLTKDSPRTAWLSASKTRMVSLTGLWPSAGTSLRSTSTVMRAMPCCSGATGGSASTPMGVSGTVTRCRSTWLESSGLVTGVSAQTAMGARAQAPSMGAVQRRARLRTPGGAMRACVG